VVAAVSLFKKVEGGSTAPRRVLRPFHSTFIPLPSYI
jgi:hypothetical protein